MTLNYLYGIIINVVTLGSDNLKVKLMVNPEHYDEIADRLNKAGITVSENAEFILTERNASITYLIGKKMKKYIV